MILKNIIRFISNLLVILLILNYKNTFTYSYCNSNPPIPIYEKIYTDECAMSVEEYYNGLHSKCNTINNKDYYTDTNYITWFNQCRQVISGENELGFTIWDSLAGSLKYVIYYIENGDKFLLQEGKDSKPSLMLTAGCDIKDNVDNNDMKDGGDESFSVSSPTYPDTLYYSQTPDVAILKNGKSKGFSNLIGSFKRSNIFTDIDFNPIELKVYAPILLIPESGLFGLDNSDIFKAKLKEYVTSGCTIVCLTQQHGYEWSALPVPEGEDKVGGYGYREDLSCQKMSVELQEWDQVLSGQSQAILDINTDGFLTSWPQSAKILFRRTKNGQPCGIKYKVGDGYVFVLCMYEDYAYTIGQSSTSARALIRDIITWSKAATGLMNQTPTMQEYRPGDSISVPVTITNKLVPDMFNQGTDKESVSVLT